MEIPNPGPVPFDIEPLSDVPSLLSARDAQSQSQVALMSDAECRRSIAHIAREVYNHEQQTTIWHKKNCGDRAGKNLVYVYLCKVYGTTDIKEQPLHEKPTTKSSLPCRFMKLSVKPCELPDLDSQHFVHLAYFECLFYVTVSKIQELHNELRLRLEHGLISPDAVLVPKTSLSGSDRQPLTVKQFLEQLHHFWNQLTKPELIATLDAAVKMRKLGHGAVVLGDGPKVIMDCRVIRAGLLLQNATSVMIHEKYVNTPGLMDIFGNKLSGPMVCMLVDDLHRTALREKEAFEAQARGMLEEMRLQEDRTVGLKDENDQTDAIKHSNASSLPSARPFGAFKHTKASSESIRCTTLTLPSACQSGAIEHAKASPDSTGHTTLPLPLIRPSGDGKTSPHSGDGLVCSNANLPPTSETGAASGPPVAQQGHRGQGRNPVTLQILRGVVQSAENRRHGAKQSHPLVVNREISALSRKSPMATAFEKLPSSPKAMKSPRISAHSSRKAPRAPVSPLCPSYRRVSKPSIPSSPREIVPTRISLLMFSADATSPLEQLKQAAANALKQAATTPLNQVITSPPSQTAARALKQAATEPLGQAITGLSKQAVAGAVSQATTSPQKQTATSPQKQSAAVPQKHTATVPQKRTTSVTQKKSTSVPQKKATSVPQKQSATSPQKQTTTVPQKQTTTVPQKQTTSVPQKQTTSVTQKKTTSVPQKQTATSPQKQTATSPQKQTASISQKQAGGGGHYRANSLTEKPLPPLPQIITNLSNQAAASALNEHATSTQKETAAIPQKQASGGGHYRKDSVTEITQQAMPLPPVDGTWSMTKKELYALLPDTPVYSTPPRLMTSKPTERSTKTSFKFLGMKVKVHIERA